MTRIEKEYQYQIMNLRKYYQTRHLTKPSANTLESVKAFAWRQAIAKIEQETDEKLMLVIKHVYIVQDKTMTAAAKNYLHYSKTVAYEIVRKWFQRFDVLFFEELKHVI